MTTTTKTNTATLLTDDMLRAVRRAGTDLRPGEPLLHRGLGGLEAVRVPALHGARVDGRRRVGARRVLRASCGSWPTWPRPRRWPPTCTATGRAWPPTCCGPGTTRCRWILTETMKGEVFAALHGEAGNDLPAAAGGGSRRAGRRRLGDLRSQDLRQPQPGVDLRRLPRHGHQRSGTSADRPRLPEPGHRRDPDHRHLGHARACGPPRARTPCSTRPSSRRARAARVPGRLRRGHRVPALDLRLGPARLLRGLPGRGQAGVRPHRGEPAPPPVDRAGRLDGPPPRGPARRGRHADRLRRRRGLPRADDRRTGPTASTTPTGRPAWWPVDRS